MKRIITPLESEIKEVYYFHKLVGHHLRHDAAISEIYYHYWRDKCMRVVLKRFLLIKQKLDLVAEKLKKIGYWHLADQEIEQYHHLQSIIDLLQDEKKQNLFKTRVVLGVEKFDKTIGKYIEDNEKKIREVFQLRNKDEAGSAALFRAIMRTMKCKVTLVRKTKDYVLTQISIAPLPYADYFVF